MIAAVQALDAYRATVESEFAWLGDLPYSAALLDEGGDIIAVNAAWSVDCHEGEGRGDECACVGWNYLAVCARAAARGENDLASGLERVLTGERGLLGRGTGSLSPSKERVFVAAPFRRGARNYAVVAHEDVTRAVPPEGQTDASDVRLNAVLAHAHEGIMAVRADGSVAYANEKAESLLGRSPVPDFGQVLTLLLTAGVRLLELQSTSGDPRTLSIGTARTEWDGAFAWLLYALDITERERSERELREKENLLERTNSAAQVGGWEVDLRTQELQWTAITRDILEVDRDSPAPSLDQALLRFYKGASYRAVQRNLEVAIAEGVPADFEARLTAASGREKWVRLYAVPEVVRGESIRLVGTFQDITRRKDLESRLARWGSAFAATAEGVLITDAQGRILAANPAFTTITGYTESEVLGATPEFLQPQGMSDEAQGFPWPAPAEEETWKGEVWVQRKDGSFFPARQTVNAVTGSDPEIPYYVAVLSDLSQLKEVERQLHHLAYHDPLTGLPNRRLFRERLDQALNRTRRTGERVAAMLLDLDDFKALNDGFGHETGDAVLRALGGRLQQMVRAGDTVARWGGDEFALLVWDSCDGIDFSRMSERMLESVEASFSIGDQRFRLGGSLGIALGDRPEIDPASLMMEADGAMYQAKHTGRRFAFYSDAVGRAARERLYLATELSRALEVRGLCVHYQRQLDLQSGRCTGLEALARWQHPTEGWISPERFIPVAERSGLILSLGEQILEQACEQASRWLRAGWDFGRMAINIARPQLEAGELPAHLSALLERTGLSPHRIELELTESLLVEQHSEVLHGLESLREKGLSVAVDDFGTGYSSLRYLKQLPVDRLKIDRSFVSGLPSDGSDRAIVQTVLTLARSLGLSVIAEGIETTAQRDVLVAEGCLRGQGFLFGSPVSASNLAGGQLVRDGGTL